jgi:hypothetical protein
MLSKMLALLNLNLVQQSQHRPLGIRQQQQQQQQQQWRQPKSPSTYTSSSVPVVQT